MLRVQLLSIVLALLPVLTSHPAASEWPQFRGPRSSGIASGKALPDEFGPGKNELWRLSPGSGHSSPSIAGDHLFLTALNPESRRLEVLGIDRHAGEILWRHEVPTEELEKGHPSFHPASGTPATDGRRVVAYFGSHGLVCLDTSGNFLWEYRLPLARSYAGHATSPVIHEDRVYLYRGTYRDHFLLALDAKTGDTVWKQPQTERFTPDMAASATPVIHSDQLIVHTARAVQGLRLSDGERIWKVACSTTATSTPVISNGEVIVSTWNQTGEPALIPRFPAFADLLAKEDRDGDGEISRKEFPRLMWFHRSEGTEAPQNGAPVHFRQVDTDGDGTIDEGEWKSLLEKDQERRKKVVPHGLIAIPLSARGTLDPEQVRVLERQGIPEVPSPLVHGGTILLIKNGGILSGIEQSSGKRLFRLRTPGRGTHYASPVRRGAHLVLASGGGQISVLDLSGARPEVRFTRDLEEPISATPAIVDGVLYVRTHEHLFAFGSSSSRERSSGEEARDSGSEER